MFRVAIRTDEIRQAVNVPVDKNGFDKGSNEGTVAFGQVKIGRFGRSIDHGSAGLVRPQTDLDIVPMLDGLVRFEPKHFKTDIAAGEIVLGMGKDEFAIFECPNDVHAGFGLRQAFEERRQAFAAFMGLRVVLNVFRLVDNGYGPGFAGLDALQQRSDLVFFRHCHGLQLPKDRVARRASGLSAKSATRRSAASRRLFVVTKKPGFGTLESQQQLRVPIGCDFDLHRFCIERPSGLHCLCRPFAHAGGISTILRTILGKWIDMHESSAEADPVRGSAIPQDTAGNVVLRFALALCGALAGLALYLLIDEKVLSGIHPRVEQWVILFALGFFPILGFALGPLTLRRALPAAVSVAGLASAMAFWAGLRFAESGSHQGFFDHGELFVLPYLILIALFVPVTISWVGNRATWRDHAVLYDIAVRAGLKFLIALVFVGLFWAVFFLSDALLLIVDLSIWKVIRKHDVISFILSFTCAGLAFAVAEEMPWVTEMLRGLLARLFILFVPILALVVGVFVVAVLARGLDMVFDSLSAAGTMLGVACGALVLVAFVVDRDDRRGHLSRLATWSMRLILLMLPVVAAIAIYALWLRVGQYGWTPSRLLAVCIAAYITLWALACAGFALFGRKWPNRIRSVNVAALVSAILVVLVWFSPVLNAQRISANSQVDRLLSGKVSLGEFDFRPLKEKWGKAGQAGLESLRTTTDHPQHAKIVSELEHFLAGQSRNQSSNRQTVNPAEKALAAILAAVPTRPIGRALPKMGAIESNRGDLWGIENLKKDCDAGQDGKPGEGCFAVFANFMLDREGEEILLVGHRHKLVLNAVLLAKTPSGTWRQQNIAYRRTGDPAAALDHVRNGTFAVAPPRVTEFSAGDFRIVPSGE